MTRLSLGKLAVFITVFALLANYSAAAPPGLGALLRADVALADLGYDSDDTVHGVLVTRDYGVRWPDAWEARTGNTFTLQFSHSPALDPRSTLTVEFNGTRLSSVLLTPENAEDGALRIAVKESLIEPGYNRLRLEFYMGLHDFNCADLDDPAVWATVHSTSAFRFSYALKAPEPDLADFPAPFIDNSPLITNHTTFILPDQPSPEELNAAVAISAKLGQLAASRMQHLRALLGVEALDPEENTGDLILVGRADRLRMLRAVQLPFMVWKEGQPLLVDRQGDPVPREAGVLWEQISPMDETAAMLVVTGATDEAVLTAARALASEASYPRLAGQLGIVLDVPDPLKADALIGQEVALEELGYEDRTAWGTREQSMRYSIPLPFAWQVGLESTFDLHFAHSAIINAKRSSLNVLLNDTPVGSIRLTPETAEEGRTTFQLPARLFESGDNKLGVTSDMDLIEDEDRRGRYDFDCLGSDPREAWLVVYADSQLNLPGGPANAALSLDDYPWAFIGPANLSDLAFVVPDSIRSAVAQATIQIAERLGHLAEGEALAPQVITAQALESLDRPPHYQILIGRPTQNAAIALMNDALPQPFKLGTDDPEPVEALAQITPPDGTVGYVQAVLSPEGYPRLVVTGTTDEGVLWASEALRDPDLLRELHGDLSIISTGGSIASAEIRPQEARQAPQPPAADQPAASKARPTDWINGLAAGLFILILVILAVRVWPKARQRSKAREHYGT